MWLFIISLYNLHLYSLNQASDKTIIVIFVSVIAFFAGWVISSLMIDKTKHNRINSKEMFSKAEASFKHLNFKVIDFMMLISLIFVTIDFAIMLPVFLRGGTSAVREACQNANSFIYTRRSGVENAFRTLIVNSFIDFISPVFVFDCFCKRKNWLFIVMFIVYQALLTVSTGGRFDLFLLGCYFVFVFFLKRRLFFKEKQSNKTRKLKIIGLFAIVSFLTVAIILISIDRFAEAANGASYYYFSMQPVMLDTWINRIDASNLYGYGSASLNGFFYPFVYFLKNISGAKSYPGLIGSISTFIEATDSQWTLISSSNEVRANAFVSPFLFFYLDGRFVGSLFIPMIWSFFCNLSFHRLEENKSPKAFILCMLLVYSVLVSFIRFQFALSGYALAFFWLFVFFKISPAKQPSTRLSLAR